MSEADRITLTFSRKSWRRILGCIGVFGVPPDLRAQFKKIEAAVQNKEQS